MTPSPVTIDKLFDAKRFSSESKWILVILYFPIGLLLTVLRFFIGFHVYVVACILPKTSAVRCFVLRVMCGVLGLIVIQHDLENRNSRSRIIVSNYTTPFDHVAIELVKPNVMPSIWDLPNILVWLLGYRDMGAKHGRETLIQNASRHCQDSSIPLLAFPEGATTNGKAGLLKFSVWPFSLEQNVQPVTIELKRPLICVAPSILNSKWWADLLWFFFVPFSVFHLRYLPEMSQTDDETPQEFAKRVQTAMAESLNVEPTMFTSGDKMEYVKRHFFSPPPPPAGSANLRSGAPSSAVAPASEMELMVSQVKVVLPHVPVEAIHKDLVLTKDIDLTITNILEGRVVFSPEEPAIEADRASSPVCPCCASSPHKPRVQNTSTSSNSSSSSVSAGTFPKKPQDRQRSFEERKKELLENARLRYIKKQGLSS